MLTALQEEKRQEEQQEVNVIFEFLNSLNEEQEKEVITVFKTANALLAMNVLKTTA